MNYFHLKNSLFLFFTTFLVTGINLAQTDSPFCNKLKNFGHFYESPDSKGLQSAKFFLSYQHQVGHIDGADKEGISFNDDFEEFRRVWMGLSGKFGTYWKFKVVSQH